MSPRLRHVLRGLGVGALATLAMDLTAFASRALGLTRGAPPEWIGRWFGLVLRGAPITDDIRLAPDVGLPLPAVLLVHYAIGASLGLAYVTIARGRESARSAIAFGLATNALPWLVMFPAMGFGLFGLDGPEDALLLRSSLVNHLGWAAGLALALRIGRRAASTLSPTAR